MASSLVNLEKGSSNNVAPDVTMTEARANIETDNNENSQYNTNEQEKEKN